MRKNHERGSSNLGWLDSLHTFSFAEYHDPAHMGFSVLRVINEDRIEGGAGFNTHSHKDMEIISYVIQGALEHKDSMGNTTIIRPGEVQIMSAGTGVRHSEYNHLQDQETHFLQIWILPDQLGLTPSYGQKSFEKELQNKNLVLVASPNGREGSVQIHQDVNIYVGQLKAQESIRFEVSKNRKAWMQIIQGSVEIHGIQAQAGDGLAIQEEALLKVTASQASQIIVFDLP